MTAAQTLILALILSPSLAAASEVLCESIEGRRAECDMNTRGEVRLVRQLSRTACTEGVNWGLSKHSIWVEGGCRAVFASADASERQNEGSSSYGRAQQGGQSPDQVACESIGGQRTECDMNTRGVVRVVRQLSRTACIEGTNWGLNKHSIWVEGGCRAVFALEGAGSSRDGGEMDARREDALYTSSGSAPSRSIDACNDYAGQARPGVLVSQNPLKPGNWEIVLRFTDGRYVCNVTSGGQVTSFEEID